MTISETQEQLRKQVKSIRLSQGFTQEGLAKRAGIPLPTLRKFEQKGQISLESFLKILVVLGCLEDIVQALKNSDEHFKSIDDVLEGCSQKPRKYGWRT
ncbi:helix-turn-helix domain-containing protein [Bartonella sp. A05]|uniref:helix-turn-helix domain-containing protein n=1 Tax=Bartonella sp. A05 TaxID=2967261 RepID=UPI0022A90CF2|nr:helix-turn-helix transcriptional regulator [Bartonella sp. A05]MCZ2203687.1 helix-turn-helix domain-containing protein [Bartonella sp. A05]